MAIHVALRHVTRYRYDRLVSLGPQVARLRPAPHCRTPVLSYSLRITPEDHFLNWQQDPYGNFLARIVVPEPAREFALEVDLTADMVNINPFDFFVEDSAEFWPFTYPKELAVDLGPYLRVSADGPLLEEWVASVPRERVRTIDLLTSLNQRLADEIGYVIRMEPGVQAPDETLERAKGSCRDSGWLLVQILRKLGLAARFTSGYLIQLRSDEESLDGPSGPDADFCDLHAWTEVYVPGAGWVGLDPTSGLLAGGGHLPVAATPEPGSAAPISGALDPCEVEFDYEMSVARIHETPRVTLPYTEPQWRSIMAAGAAVDERLRQDDVRLTMGGEPTFVSIDDRSSPEWNTEANGFHKAALASELASRLRQRFAPQGAIQFGQGKWYPGEPLPRWAYSLFWRTDFEPLWERSALIAVEPSEAATIEAARVIAGHITVRLGVDPEHLIAAFDPPDPLNPTRPLTPRGFVLPLQPWQSRDARRWRSERWRPRHDRLYLLDGDSPAGLRLPFEDLVFDERDDGEDSALATTPQVPFEGAEPLPSPGQLRLERGRQSVPPQGQTSWVWGPGPVRTALTIEPRGGFLYVFLPPVATAEQYVDLIGSVEDAAAEADVPVRLEGYEPPPDHRIRCLRVTPDPGVIEVNTAPAASWAELVEATEALYDEARQTRLGTEKFMLDGKHTGTGGGNHVVLGGPTPADSPFLRRPDTVRSFVAYFINHPSLSFLFSGLFIGPTSQAPRVDQARDDALYELEIAFSQVPSRDDPATPLRPWVIDRVLRDVLVDVTGNTHRTEICIDKLYSPDSASGRQGLVEFRSFEMPPHARMSLAQGLLMRALTAHFWRTPYTRPLQQWGTRLHDRFMLPRFVWQDFEEVVAELQADGIPIDASWFRPHFEFRFPSLGSFAYRGIEVELREALEPWHVTGEHGVAAGTARYVDSSLERVQVRVNQTVSPRYVVTCNGRAVPLTPTGVQGERVAGVRYRAWHPPQCLHPTIGLHAPLRIDLVDTWSGQSVAGCTYHVGHPGGRNHEIFPINALEAEGRRLARFSVHAHTSGPMSVPEEPVNPAFPCTLDLRRG